MQEILDALGPISITNVASLLVLIWGPGLAIAAVVLFRFYQERKTLPPELVVAVFGIFLSVSFIPLMAAWQSFEVLSFVGWAKLTGAQLGMALVIIGVAQQAFKGEKSRAAHHFGAEWKRRSHIWAIALPLIGSLLTVASAWNFIDYMRADTATATVISQKYGPSGRQLLINAEWAAPDGKKTSVVLTFDQRDAFRPKLSPGVELPFRLNATEAAAGKVEPLYVIDIGVVAVLLGHLSTFAFGLGALLAGLIMQREKKS